MVLGYFHQSQWRVFILIRGFDQQDVLVGHSSISSDASKSPPQLSWSALIFLVDMSVPAWTQLVDPVVASLLQVCVLQGQFRLRMDNFGWTKRVGTKPCSRASSKPKFMSSSKD